MSPLLHLLLLYAHDIVRDGRGGNGTKKKKNSRVDELTSSLHFRWFWTSFTDLRARRVPV